MIALSTLFFFNIRADAQGTWVPIPGGASVDLNAVSFADSLNGIIAGMDGHYSRTTDGGYSWTADTIPYIWRHDDIVHATSDTVLMNGHSPCFDIDCGVVYRSTDAGATWLQDSSSINEPTDAMSFATPSHGVAVGGNYNGWTAETHATCLRTSDGGNRWQAIHPYTGTLPVMERITDVAYPDTGFLVAVCEGGRVLRYLRDSVDAYLVGSIWDTLAVLLPGLRSVSFIDTVSGTVVGDSGRIWGTTNGGQTWSPQASGTGVTLRSVQFLSENAGAIAGEGGTILGTTNGGTSWTPAPGIPAVNLNKIFFSDPGHGWAVGDGGTVLRYGETPLCVLSANEIDFGGVIIGQGKGDSIRVSNPGSDTLSVSLSVDHPDFTFEETYNVVPGSAAWIVVRFDPTAIGPAQAALVLLHNAPMSPDTVLLRGNAIELDSTTVAFAARWNMVSMPRTVLNDSVPFIFPNAASPAYRYDPDFGYVTSLRIEPGVGYWIKFPTAETLSIAGYTVLSDTIGVRAGWNLVGTISVPVPAISVVSVPPGIVSSRFWNYDLGYNSLPVVLAPGRAYWVKVSSDGVIILAAP